jgi:hypothetical protein
MGRIVAAALILGLTAAPSQDNVPPEGFTALFNGKDLTGWQGVVPLPRRSPDPAKYAEQVTAANAKVLPHWTVQDGVLCYDGKGDSLQTAKDYGDFELRVDWKITPKGDSGIYVRGTPQIQIWDADQHPEGSGGLFNNARHPSKPLKRADRPAGQWNTFRIIVRGDKVTVHLNGELVVDQVTLENYWDRKKDPNAPLPARGPIELQHHGSPLEFKNIFIKELD